MNKVIMTNDSTVKILTKFLKTWIWHLKTCVPMTKNLTTRQENMHGVVELDCSPTLMWFHDEFAAAATNKSHQPYASLGSK
jgi:hypothetical protein